MKMEIRKKALVNFIIAILFFCSTTGCGSEKTNTGDSPKTAIAPVSVQNTTKEIPVEFPFREEQHYTLVLALTDESLHKYELCLYDQKQTLIQQIPCGTLTEPVRFSYDDLVYGVYHGLEIFPADGSTGLFLEWQPDEEHFSENVVEIPKYTEARGNVMLAVEANNTCQVKRIYQYNIYQKRVDELRRWELQYLQKNTGLLIIWDYLEQQHLFHGTTALTEEGQPENSEFYDLLFWKDLYLPRDLGETDDQSSITVWADEPVTKEQAAIQRKLFGDDSLLGECESREALLTVLGMDESTPMYQYFDCYGNLHLELYQNAASGQLCGIVHEYCFDNTWKKSETMYGFIINDIQEGEWTGHDPFSTKTVYGSDGADFVDAYEEITCDTPDGKPDYFRSQGLMERDEDGELKELLSTVVEINFIYRDDGTLYCRDYHHNERLFGTTYLSMDSYYDEGGRISYETGYITHGMLENYYIYKDDSEKPAYSLLLDYAGYVIPTIVHY